MSAELVDQKSIDDLPIEMLEKVFLAVDAKSLKNCCLVSKKWNNVIGQSSSVMEKLPLLLCETYKIPRPDIYHATKNYERKYHTINISLDFCDDEYAIKILEKFVAECRKIRFFWCRSFNNMISMKSLKFPLLESAEISYPYANEEISFSQLASQMLKILSSTQLKEFSYAGRSEFSELMTFLSTQTKLTELSLYFDDCNISKRCLSDIERIQVPLKTLSLTIFNDGKYSEQIVAFLSRFTETLEDLTLSLYNICGSVFKLIFTKLNKLKSLSIRINSAPQEISFYHKLRPNYSVKKLVVESFVSNNQETFDKFIGLLPNVETLELTLSKIPDDTLLFVSNHLKRLTTLELDNVNSFVVVKFARVCLPSVKTIVFGNIGRIQREQWKLIVDALPNVESMSVESVFDAKSLSCQSIEIIAKSWSNLTSLKFGRYFVAHDQIFNELLCNCKNMKTIEVREDAFETETSKAKILERVKEHGLRLIVYKNY